MHDGERLKKAWYSPVWTSPWKLKNTRKPNNLTPHYHVPRSFVHFFVNCSYHMLDPGLSPCAHSFAAEMNHCRMEGGGWSKRKMHEDRMRMRGIDIKAGGIKLVVLLGGYYNLFTYRWAFVYKRLTHRLSRSPASHLCLTLIYYGSEIIQSPHPYRSHLPQHHQCLSCDHL